LLQAQAARRRCGDNAGDRDEMGESRAAGSTPPTLLPPLAVEGAPPRFLVEDLLLPCSSGAAPLLDHLRVHGWAVLRDTAPGVDLFVAVEESWRAFFSEEDGAKKRHKQSCPGKIGRLHMWSTGYSKQKVREQFHIVVVRASHPSPPH
jgi:hypothetical protein